MGNRGDRLSALSRAAILLLAMAIAAPAGAAACPTGRFRAAAGPDTASMLEIGKDGRFRYGLSEGAVDEVAQGRWTCVDGVLRLTTEPMPKPAAFRLGAVSQGETPFSLIVTWPNGDPIAGVHVRILFDQGEPVEGATQADGWSSALDGRVPRSVQVAEPFYRTVSPVFPLPAGDRVRLHIVLEPNDMGMAAFDGTRVRSEGGQLVLEWRGGELPYERDD